MQVRDPDEQLVPGYFLELCDCTPGFSAQDRRFLLRQANFGEL